MITIWGNLVSWFCIKKKKKTRNEDRIVQKQKLTKNIVKLLPRLDARRYAFGRQWWSCEDRYTISLRISQYYCCDSRPHRRERVSAPVGLPNLRFFQIPHPPTFGWRLCSEVYKWLCLQTKHVATHLYFKFRWQILLKSTCLYVYNNTHLPRQCKRPNVHWKATVYWRYWYQQGSNMIITAMEAQSTRSLPNLTWKNELLCCWANLLGLQGIDLCIVCSKNTRVASCFTTILLTYFPHPVLRLEDPSTCRQSKTNGWETLVYC